MTDPKLDEEFQDELLRPTLSSQARRRTRPKPCWRPGSIVVASFFVGPFGSAFLVATNNARLACRNLRWLLTLSPLLAPLVAVLLVNADWVEAHQDEFTTTLFFAMAVLQVAGTHWATRPQVVPFHIYEQGGYKPVNIFGFAVGALILNGIMLRLFKFLLAMAAEA